MNHSEHPTSLRERKKARTRVLLRDSAMRLFREQGYEATTVEQIADEADIALRTFYRYFPNKEEVVLYDAFDLSIAEKIKSLPPDKSVCRAIRAALNAVYGSLPKDRQAIEQLRHELIIKTPELYMRQLVKLAGGISFISAVFAERMNLPADDPAVRTAAGAVFGVSVAALVSVVEARESRLNMYLQRIDEGLRQLEKGLAF